MTVNSEVGPIGNEKRVCIYYSRNARSRIPQSKREPKFSKNGVLGNYD